MYVHCPIQNLELRPPELVEALDPEASIPP